MSYGVLLSAFFWVLKRRGLGVYMKEEDVEKGKDPGRLERGGESSRAQGWEKLLECLR
jgi:hypothetical protein